MALNAVTGIWLVRTLPLHEYAWLTIINAMIATYGVILEPITGSGLLSVEKEEGAQEKHLSNVISSALQARWIWLALLALFVTPWTFYLLQRAGAPITTALLLLFIGMAGLPALTGTAIRMTIPKIRGETNTLQLMDACGVLSRLALSVLFTLIQKLSALAVLAATMAQLLQHQLSGRIASGGHRLTPLPDAAVTTKLHALMRAMLAHTVFQCFQAHLGIWMLSLFGTQESVAHYGALSRLAVLFAPLGALYQQMIIPKFATRHSIAEKRSLAWKSFTVLILCSTLAILTCLYFPLPLLWILGPSYHHLTAELPVAMTLFSLTTLSTILWWFNTASGATRLSRWVPLAVLITFCLGTLIIKPYDTLTVLQVIVMGTSVSLIIGMIQSICVLSPPSFNSSRPS